MTYEIGQKVETPLGVGTISYIDSEFAWVSIKGTPEIEFDIRHLKPYKTAHERLLEMGWEDVETYSVDIIEYRKDGSEIYVYKRDKKYEAYDGLSSAYSMNLELSRILTQYLEEMAE